MNNIDFFPETAQKAMLLLQEAGYEAYFVGGCVRDFYMSKNADDFDLTTNASSDEIIKILSCGGFDAKLIGGNCGTVGAKENEIQLEITPYRTESGYSDHRHPKKVEFTKDIRSDLSRRDFTINCLAVTIKDNKIVLVDCFGGITDIKNKIIRCVGDPQIRFEEDALRILRALRFATRLGFSIEGKTAKAMCEKKALLKFISAERKCEELMKIVENPEISVFLDDFFAVFSEIVGNFVGKGIDFVPNKFCDRMFFMLRFRSENEIVSVLNGLKLNKKAFEKIIKYKRIFDLINEKNCDIFKLTTRFGYLVADYLKIFGEYDKYADFFENKSIPKTISELDIDGKDIGELGYKGEEIGKVLKNLLGFAILSQVKNEKTQLKTFVKENSFDF